MDNKTRFLVEKRGFVTKGDESFFRQAHDKAIKGKKLNTKESEFIVKIYADIMTRMSTDNTIYNSFSNNYKKNPNSAET